MTKLPLFIAIRVVNALTLRTFWSPDEYWQSLEVAHKLVFGYGHLTWEWEYGIRSSLHPMLFATVYKTIETAGLAENIDAVYLGPKLFQAILAAINDHYTVKLANILYGGRVSMWAAWLTVFSWFNWYASTRTFVNSLEMTLTTISLYLWNKVCNGRTLNLLSFSHCLGIVFFTSYIRPSASVFWFLLVFAYGILSLKTNLMYLKSIAVSGMLSGIIAFVLCVSIDFLFYGKLLIVPWEFFKLNVHHGISRFYGEHSVHWYLSQGLPVILATFLIPSLIGINMIMRESRPFRIQVFCMLITIGVYSLIAHKEFRFLQFMLPQLLICAAVSLAQIKKLSRKLIVLLFLPQILMSIYFSAFHQPGVIQVTRWLHDNIPSAKNNTIFFAMPCHSTPFHSHVHRSDLKLEFLTCEPPLKRSYISNMSTEMEFYKNPRLVLSRLVKSRDDISAIVCFESLLNTDGLSLGEFLFLNGYLEEISFFNGYFIDDKRRSGRVYVFLKK